MKLFNFLNRKEKSPESNSSKKIERSECDISKTQIIANLFNIPSAERDEKWNQLLFDNATTASFACGNPQVTVGPDGFPYFNLIVPEPNMPFESFCISNMKENFLLEKGFGVTLSSKVNTVEWVFSYGQIVNLHLNNQFYSAADPVKIKNQETITTNQEVLVGQPSEQFLPKPTREILKKHLQTKGILKPQIMLLIRKIEGIPVRELAINIFKEDYSTIEELNNIMHQISWFLPNHYIILSLPKNSEWSKYYAPL